MTTSARTAYAADILSQPDCLRRVDMPAIGKSLASISPSFGQFRKIVLTGMGASHAALRPLWMGFVGKGYPAWRVETSELLASMLPLLDSSTLLIMASQSGRSAEIIAGIEEATSRRSVVVAITNDPASPLAAGARAVVNINAGIENAVSTKTYLNTLAAAIAIRRALLGEPFDDTLPRAADALAAYLESLQDRIQVMKDSIGLPDRLFYLARGASMAAAEYGALIMKEAAKWPVEAQSSAQFRHGPLELADERLTAVILSGGADRERELNSALATDLRGYGAKVFRLDRAPSEPALRMPDIPGEARSLAEALPLQLLTIAIAEQAGTEPGVFRHLSKVTTVQ
jgi:glucosamine--fructose-6-phosphate aminotransferase (isomerizing)